MNPVCDNGDSKRFVDYLNEIKAQIVWAQNSTELFKLIAVIRRLCDASTNDLLKEIDVKLRRLDSYLQVDLLCHITSPVARDPFYFKALQDLLEKLFHNLQAKTSGDNPTENGKVKSDEGLKQSRTVSDNLAELNLFLLEFGFVSCFEDDSQDAEEKSRQLAAWKQILQEIEKSLLDKPMYESACKLRDVIRKLARKIEHSTTTAVSASNLAPELAETETEVERIEGLLIENALKSNEPDTIKYMAMFHLLKKEFKSKIYRAANDVSILTTHVLHPATRGWLFDRIRRWIDKPRTVDRRLFYVMGKQGFGRTSIAAAVCKLHSSDVLAFHFFDQKVKTDASLHNSLIGLIQSIASGLMQTLPEYINYLDDKFSNLTDLEAKLNSTWQEVYSFLIKDPLQAVYGKPMVDQRNGKLQTTEKNGKTQGRKLIVIDSLDNCAMTDWKDFYTFLTQFLKDTGDRFCIFVTLRSKKSAAILPTLSAEWEGIRLDDKAWIGSHVADIERYMAHSVGTIVSEGPIPDDDEMKPASTGRAHRIDKREPAVTGTSPTSSSHGRVDQKSLEQTVDEFVKMSAGRFDWAVELVELFSREMATSGHQYIGSVKRVGAQMRELHGGTNPPTSPGAVGLKRGPGSLGSTEKSFVERTTEFCGSFRAYRDKTGRAEEVKVTSPRQHVQSTSRLPLLVSRLHLE